MWLKKVLWIILMQGPRLLFFPIVRPCDHHQFLKLEEAVGNVWVMPLFSNTNVSGCCLCLCWNVNAVAQVSALSRKDRFSVYTVCRVFILQMKRATLLLVEFCWSIFWPKGILQLRDSYVSLLQLHQQNPVMQAQETNLICNFSDCIWICRVNHLNKLPSRKYLLS